MRFMAGAICARRSVRITNSGIFAAVFVVHVVVDAEAVARCGVHLLRGVDRVLQLGDAILHLGQLFLDLVLQVADLLLRHLKRCFVKLALLVGQNRHLMPPSRLVD
jgi:hypothetical protein